MALSRPILTTSRGSWRSTETIPPRQETRTSRRGSSTSLSCGGSKPSLRRLRRQGEGQRSAERVSSASSMRSGLRGASRPIALGAASLPSSHGRGPQEGRERAGLRQRVRLPATGAQHQRRRSSSRHRSATPRPGRPRARRWAVANPRSRGTVGPADGHEEGEDRAPEEKALRTPTSYCQTNRHPLPDNKRPSQAEPQVPLDPRRRPFAQALADLLLADLLKYPPRTS
jgi:hypothetical protein